ncbi:GlxA family transcriptional regulator [Corynebacterium glyciniphilum]|uniref:GlxA family transcriptional regulator n=1 Tax=Corynebacterium glyciniphilum TaxID=1404244 RepID=UPI0011AB860D|nr:helix-turn-helix domain-containing protein [Corynebacterium glyciniphilum]
MSNNSRQHSRAHQVVILAFPEVVAFDLSTAAQIFGFRDEDEYQATVVGAAPGEVSTSTGFSIGGVAGPEEILHADTVIVPGFNSRLDVADPATTRVLDLLRHASEHGIRVVSICTGAFALAAAGLLDGRSATTHWCRTGELQKSYPALTVDPGVLYIDHGDIATSAGVAAGIDLCLHLVRRDMGEDVGARIARRMVVAPHRTGGQAQFIEHPTPKPGVGMSPVVQWMTEHLAEPLTVADCANEAGMSLRHFQRRFTVEFGEPPAAWLNRQRVTEARRLLEVSDLTVDAIARRTGLGSATNMRRHVLAQVGVTPTAYRRNFRRMS